MFFFNYDRIYFLNEAFNDAVPDIFAVGKDTSSFILPQIAQSVYFYRRSIDNGGTIEYNINRMEAVIMKYYEYFLSMKIFTFAEAVNLIGNEKTAKSLLQQYCKKGYLASVKKGLYVTVNIVDKEPVVNKYAIASALTDTSYVSHRSAFEYYGYTNQVSYDMSVTSTQKFNSFDFGGYRYYRIAPAITTGIVIQPDGVRITDTERTLTDCINSLETHIGLEELLNCISAIPALSEEKLMRYLDEYKKMFLYQKTGFLLEHFQNRFDISAGFFDVCKQKSGKSSRYLTKTTSKNAMGFSAKWHLTYPKNIWSDLLNGGSEDAEI